MLKSGYLPPKDGPFHCGGCEYFRDVPKSNGVTCNKPEVQADAKANHGRVEPEGCCNFFEPRD